jgi:DNA-directed RNA polymerase specialized sigma24 family protein
MAANSSASSSSLDEMLDQMAVDLYNLASMMVGEGEESIRLVEQAVANAEVSSGDSPAEARKSSHVALAKAALETIARRDPGSLAAPKGTFAPPTCIDDDDLDSAGVSAEELERMFAGPDRDRIREWLSKLPTALRAVFALRAVAGFNAAETAGLLAAHGGPSAEAWNPESVREIFRQGLCALASQLLHASAAR